MPDIDEEIRTGYRELAAKIGRDRSVFLDLQKTFKRLAGTGGKKDLYAQSFASFMSIRIWLDVSKVLNDHNNELEKFTDNPSTYFSQSIRNWQPPRAQGYMAKNMDKVGPPVLAWLALLHPNELRNFLERSSDVIGIDQFECRSPETTETFVYLRSSQQVFERIEQLNKEIGDISNTTGGDVQGWFEKWLQKLTLRDNNQKLLFARLAFLVSLLGGLIAATSLLVILSSHGSARKVEQQSHTTISYLEEVFDPSQAFIDLSPLTQTEMLERSVRRQSMNGRQLGRIYNQLTIANLLSDPKIAQAYLENARSNAPNSIRSLVLPIFVEGTEKQTGALDGLRKLDDAAAKILLRNSHWLNPETSDIERFSDAEEYWFEINQLEDDGLSELLVLFHAAFLIDSGQQLYSKNLLLRLSDCAGIKSRALINYCLLLKILTSDYADKSTSMSEELKDLSGKAQIDGQFILSVKTDLLLLAMLDDTKQGYVSSSKELLDRIVETLALLEPGQLKFMLTAELAHRAKLLFATELEQLSFFRDAVAEMPNNYPTKASMEILKEYIQFEIHYGEPDVARSWLARLDTFVSSFDRDLVKANNFRVISGFYLMLGQNDRSLELIVEANLIYQKYVEDRYRQCIDEGPSIESWFRLRNLADSYKADLETILNYTLHDLFNFALVRCAAQISLESDGYIDANTFSRARRIGSMLDLFSTSLYPERLYPDIADFKEYIASEIENVRNVVDEFDVQSENRIRRSLLNDEIQLGLMFASEGNKQSFELLKFETMFENLMVSHGIEDVTKNSVFSENFDIKRLVDIVERHNWHPNSLEGDLYPEFSTWIMKVQEFSSIYESANAKHIWLTEYFLQHAIEYENYRMFRTCQITALQWVAVKKIKTLAEQTGTVFDDYASKILELGDQKIVQLDDPHDLTNVENLRLYILADKLALLSLFDQVREKESLAQRRMLRNQIETIVFETIEEWEPWISPDLDDFTWSSRILRAFELSGELGCAGPSVAGEFYEDL